MEFNRNSDLNNHTPENTAEGGSPPVRRPATMAEYLLLNGILIVAIVLASFPATSLPLFSLAVIPICLVLVCVRFETLYAFLSLALCVALPSLFRLTLDFGILFDAAPAALLMALMLRRRGGLMSVVSVGVAGYLASSGGLGAAVLLGGGRTAVASGLQSSSLYSAYSVVCESAGTDNIFSAFQSAVVDAFAQAGFGENIANSYYSLVLACLPALLICYFALLAGLCYFTLRALLCRRDASFAYLRPFSMLHADRVTALVYLGCMVAALFVQSYIVQAVFVDAFLIVSLMLMACGISVVCSFIGRTRSGVVRGVLYAAAVLLLPLVFYTYLFIGFLDAFFNLRRIGRTVR